MPPVHLDAHLYGLQVRPWGRACGHSIGCIALHCMAWHCIAWHCIALQVWSYPPTHPLGMKYIDLALGMAERLDLEVGTKSP